MDRRLLYAPLAVGVALLVAPILAQGASSLTASDSDDHGRGQAESARLEIELEAGLDPSSLLVPDSPGCSATGPGCPGGNLNFSIENKSGVPVRVTNLQQATGRCAGTGKPTTCPAPIASDRLDNGQRVAAPDYTSTAANSCGTYARFSPPNLTAAPWPVIPAHGTLQVNGTDGYALGAHLIHLVSTTPSACQGAGLFVPLSVTATDAS